MTSTDDVKYISLKMTAKDRKKRIRRAARKCEDQELSVAFNEDGDLNNTKLDKEDPNFKDKPDEEDSDSDSSDAETVVGEDLTNVIWQSCSKMEAKVDDTTHGLERESNHPFSSKECMTAFVMTSLKEYVLDSVKEMMLDILTTPDIKEIPALVKRFFDLPLEYNFETLNLTKAYVFKTMGLNIQNKKRVVAFWKAVNKVLKKSSAAQELKVDFLGLLKHALLRRAGPDHEQKKSWLHLLDSDITNGETQEQCQSETYPPDNLTHKRAIEVAELIAMLSSSGFVDAYQMLYFLMDLNSLSDDTSMYLLIVLMEKVAGSLDQAYLTNYSFSFGGKDLNVEMELIYKKLDLIGNDKVSGLSPALRKRARQIVLRKKADVCYWTRVFEKDCGIASNITHKKTVKTLIRPSSDQSSESEMQNEKLEVEDIPQKAQPDVMLEQCLDTHASGPETQNEKPEVEDSQQQASSDVEKVIEEFLDTYAGVSTSM